MLDATAVRLRMASMKISEVAQSVAILAIIYVIFIIATIVWR